MEVTYQLTADDLYAFQWRANYTSPKSRRARRMAYLYLCLPFVVIALLPTIGPGGFRIAQIDLIFLVAVLPLLAGLYWVIQHRMMRRAIKAMVKQEKPDKGQLGTHTIVLGEEGLVETTAVGETRTSWAGYEIVGVVRDTKLQSLREGIEPMVYVANTQEKDAGNGTRFGVLASLLAAVGLYGVMSYVVARCSNEIGIRMAMGAGRADVLRMVLGETAWLLAASVAVGTGLAIGSAGYARSLLFQLNPTDPATVVSAGGCWERSGSSPASCRRAARRGSIRRSHCATNDAVFRPMMRLRHTIPT